MASAGIRLRPLGSQGVFKSLDLALLPPGGILVEDLKVGSHFRICGEVRRVDQVERSAGGPTFDVERQGQWVTDAQGGRVGRRREQVIADAAAKRWRSWNGNVACLDRHRRSDCDYSPAGIGTTLQTVNERPFHDCGAQAKVPAFEGVTLRLSS